MSVDAYHSTKLSLSNIVTYGQRMCQTRVSISVAISFRSFVLMAVAFFFFFTLAVNPLQSPSFFHLKFKAYICFTSFMSVLHFSKLV